MKPSCPLLDSQDLSRHPGQLAYPALPQKLVALVMCSQQLSKKSIQAGRFRDWCFCLKECVAPVFVESWPRNPRPKPKEAILFSNGEPFMRMRQECDTHGLVSKSGDPKCLVSFWLAFKAHQNTEARVLVRDKYHSQHKFP